MTEDDDPIEDPDNRYSSFQPFFWSTGSYTSYADACESGGTYEGEMCEGYTAFQDAMANVRAAVTCLDSMGVEDLRMRLFINGEDVGDFTLHGNRHVEKPT